MKTTKKTPTQRTRRASRADIAALANVSLATVTYALNPSPNSRISKATSDRVRQIAEELGYRPDFVHRSMSAGRTFAIGLILPESKSLLFPFYELMIEGLLKTMNADDYDPLFLIRSHWDRVDKVVRQGRVDGLVILQSDLNDQFIRRAAATGVPLVVMNRDLPHGLDSDQAVCVFSDHEQMMQEVVNEFVDLGCKRLLNFSNTKATFADQKSALAFEVQIARHTEKGVTGKTLEPDWSAIAPRADHAFKGDDRWDGIFVNGGEIAAEVIRVAESHGLAPGRDFQLITRDAFPDTYGYLSPPPPRLSRRERAVFLQQPLQVGENAWAVMADLLNGKPVTHPEVRVPYCREEIKKC